VAEVSRGLKANEVLEVNVVKLDQLDQLVQEAAGVKKV